MRFIHSQKSCCLLRTQQGPCVFFSVTTIKPLIDALYSLRKQASIPENKLISFTADCDRKAYMFKHRCVLCLCTLNFWSVNCVCASEVWIESEWSMMWTSLDGIELLDNHFLIRFNDHAPNSIHFFRSQNRTESDHKCFLFKRDQNYVSIYCTFETHTHKHTLTIW